jgi:hypothetical protein
MSIATSPFGPLVVLLDPRAGDRDTATEVERALDAGGLDYRLQIGTSSAELTRLSRAALDEGYRFVAATGSPSSRSRCSASSRRAGATCR